MIIDLITLAEKGYLPDQLIRFGIRKLCKERLKMVNSNRSESFNQNSWINELKNSPIAIVPEKANEQHYEVPPMFFQKVLGNHMKYSSGYWDDSTNDIDTSELLMLDKTIKGADITDGMKILELGCGWGSLTFHIAKSFPNSSVLAVSNSKDQKKFILDKCKKNNISNVEIITEDMNNFLTDEKFDRVISVEMFEHMRNYKVLLNKISNFLNDDGKLFVHIFSHHTMVYPYVDNGPGDWMAREFFSGGLMPSHKLLLHFQDDLKIESLWKINGQHYEKTSYAWLKRMDDNKNDILSIFNNTYGKKDAKMWFQRWRIFFLSCAVMFGIKKGTEWGVSHYRFTK